MENSTGLVGPLKGLWQGGMAGFNRQGGPRRKASQTRRCSERQEDLREEWTGEETWVGLERGGVGGRAGKLEEARAGTSGSQAVVAREGHPSRNGSAGPWARHGQEHLEIWGTLGGGKRDGGDCETLEINLEQRRRQAGGPLSQGSGAEGRVGGEGGRAARLGQRDPNGSPWSWTLALDQSSLC